MKPKGLGTMMLISVKFKETNARDKLLDALQLHKQPPPKPSFEVIHWELELADGMLLKAMVCS